MWRDFPELRLQVAELDPEVVNVAYRYFALPRDPRLAIEVEDGRRYLAAERAALGRDRASTRSTPTRSRSTSPPASSSSSSRSRLNPGGVVVANVIGALAGPDSKLFRSFYADLPLGLPDRRDAPGRLPGETRPRDPQHHRGRRDGRPRPQAFLRERWDGVRSEHPAAPDLTSAINRRYDKPCRRATCRCSPTTTRRPTRPARSWTD